MLRRCIQVLPTIASTLAIAVYTSLVALAQYGAKTAKPYTEADVEYGRKQQARIDTQRTEYAEKKLEKQAADPFHIVGDLYWVGVHNWGCALIKTADGCILIDTVWADTAPLVAKDIEQLGFKLTDIKIILMTEAHGDHNGGTAWMKEKSGAQVMVMEGDAAAAEAGTGIPAVKVDRVLHDRDQVKLGGKVLTAYHIPGHTLGSTTWVWQETEDGVTYNVADVCCWFTPNNVVSDPQYPTERLRKNWDVLKSLPVDIPFPGIHAYHFDTWGKLELLKSGKVKNPWIDPQGYRGVIAAFERDFEDKVKQQLKDGPPPPRAPKKKQ